MYDLWQTRGAVGGTARRVAAMLRRRPPVRRAGLGVQDSEEATGSRRGGAVAVAVAELMRARTRRQSGAPVEATPI